MLLFSPPPCCFVRLLEKFYLFVLILRVLLRYSYRYMLFMHVYMFVITRGATRSVYSIQSEHETLLIIYMKLKSK